MSQNFRNSKFDVVLVAGPRTSPWPTEGAVSLSRVCADFGLEVGWVGGNDLKPKGIIPLPGTGGIVFSEDSQGRIHRIHGRSVVRFTCAPEFPDPFSGWYSPGVIPGSTAIKLFERGGVQWNRPVVLLGSSNQAFRFGSVLLENGCPEVFLIESGGGASSKSYSGWEVEKRRFEILGGRFMEAAPVSLDRVGPLHFELRIKDNRGVRVIETARVVSFGPFSKSDGVREHPPSSLLFDFEQQASEGLLVEVEKSKLLATKIIRTLSPDLGLSRELLDLLQKRSKNRIRRYLKHADQPFQIEYQGKWSSLQSLKAIKSFSGTPKVEHLNRPIASIECFETIGCDACARVCPENAIQFDRLRSRRADEQPMPILTEADCTACGLCLTACPSQTPLLIHEIEKASHSKLTFPWRDSKDLSVGDTLTLLNRKGEVLGTSRVSDFRQIENSKTKSRLVTVEVPNPLVWEARGLRRPRAHASAEDKEFLRQDSSLNVARVEVSMNGERRLVRDRVSISDALFETGQNRSEDMLFCEDGSCGLCEVEVDGNKTLACTSQIRRGMAIRWPRERTQGSSLCPCQKISKEDFQARIELGKLNTPEAAFETSGICSGKCHGQICSDPARRALEQSPGAFAEVSDFVDWKFPWVDWRIDPAKLD